MLSRDHLIPNINSAKRQFFIFNIKEEKFVECRRHSLPISVSVGLRLFVTYRPCYFKLSMGVILINNSPRSNPILLTI